MTRRHVLEGTNNKILTTINSRISKLYFIVYYSSLLQISRHQILPIATSCNLIFDSMAASVLAQPRTAERHPPLEPF